jgi:hypothetical protein
VRAAAAVGGRRRVGRAQPRYPRRGGATHPAAMNRSLAAPGSASARLSAGAFAPSHNQLAEERPNRPRRRRSVAGCCKNRETAYRKYQFLRLLYRRGRRLPLDLIEVPTPKAVSSDGRLPNPEPHAPPGALWTPLGPDPARSPRPRRSWPPCTNVLPRRRPHMPLTTSASLCRLTLSARRPGAHDSSLRRRRRRAADVLRAGRALLAPARAARLAAVAQRDSHRAERAARGRVPEESVLERREGEDVHLAGGDVLRRGGGVGGWWRRG